MKLRNRQPGFTLITAIFLLVAVAGLVTFMINLRAVQQTTLVYGVQGARAMQAARAGVEWGVYEALNAAPPNCPFNPTFNTSGSVLDGFQITVSCTPTLHIEGAVSITTYQITATAESGTYPSIDYVSRALQATISLPPP